MAHGLVQFEGVWKKFRRGERHDSLRDLIPAAVRAAVRPRPSSELKEQEFWALRNVSFEVGQGKALGIIGANGAGKSTVLKLLTRILRPTRGRCAVEGRVGALIEIAAGFHEDLTGRENVYLQGAIMGMRRTEIARKFDEIVEFSGLGDFIDTPVKRYSSGMNARLGFAIAAHLDPDVLIIDEVLAVGDHAFQAKAFARIKQILGHGIPVVIVSHQLDRVASLCTEVLVLSRGQVVRAGPAAECVAAYIEQQTRRTVAVDTGGRTRLTDVAPLGERVVRSGARTSVRVEGIIDEPAGQSDGHSAELHVRSVTTGEVIFITGSRDHGIALPVATPFALEVDLQMNVPPGLYAVETVIWDATRQWKVADGPVMHLQVIEGPPFAGRTQLNARVRIAAALSAIAAATEPA